MSGASEPSLGDDLASLRGEAVGLLAAIAERDEAQQRDRQRLAEIRAIITGIERAVRKIAAEAQAAVEGSALADEAAP